MYESQQNEWYGLHFLETNSMVKQYFTEMREWMDEHQSEMVVIWMSKHGDQCAKGNDQFPGVSVPAKQAFWSVFTTIFAGLLVDSSVHPYSSTPLNTLLANGQRLAVYASDWVELTSSSKYAVDGCLVDNQLGGDIEGEEAAYSWEASTFQGAKAHRDKDKAEGKFYLVSLASGTPPDMVTYNAELEYQPFRHDSIKEKCAALFHIPNMTGWCPTTLIDMGQLTAYYKQLTLDLAVTTEGWDFPNAIYMDSIDVGGTIRTSIDPLPAAPTAATKRFGYSDSMILANLYRICPGGRKPTTAACQELIPLMEARRALFPVQRWKDEEHGRLTNWPPSTIITQEDRQAGWSLGLEKTSNTTGRSFFVKGGQELRSMAHAGVKNNVLVSRALSRADVA